MSTYRALKGYSIKSVTSDPANTKEGQIWYNSSVRAIKLSPLIGAWASGGAMNTAKQECGGCGTQTAGLVWAGTFEDGDTVDASLTVDTEEYNGAAWAEQNNLGTKRSFLASAGTQTAALTAGGQNGDTVYVNTEEYGGTSWTAGGNLPAAKSNWCGLGTQTAALALAAQQNTAAGVNVEAYDGSSWSEGPNINTGRNNAAAAGTSTAGLLVCGFAPGVPGRVIHVEEYDGTSWSEQANYPTALNQLGGSGLQTDSVFFGGGAPAKQTAANTYDGTAFATTGALANANGEMGTTTGTPTASGALSMGGNGPPAYRTQTEEFTNAPVTRTADLS